MSLLFISTHRRRLSLRQRLKLLKTGTRIVLSTELCRGKDGSAKCDATETGDIEHSIIGVVNDICKSEKPILDQNVFSEHYVQAIADAESVDDPNTERHEVEMSIYH